MNQTIRNVMEIYQVGVVVRDTLEYLFPRENGYDPEFYKRRKNILEISFKEGHPFAKFLKDNKETGEKIMNYVKEFYDMVYGDEARVVFIENDKVVVDSGYTTQLLDYVIGIHESINDMLVALTGFLKEKEFYEEDFGTLLVKDNAFYRSLACLIVTDHMHRLFVEFNKEMQASKGQPTPQSNFIQNDLGKVFGYFNFLKERAKINDDIFTLAVNKTNFVMDLMTGKTKIDEKGGLGIKEEIDNLHSLWYKTLSLAEGEYQPVYRKVVEDIIAFDKKRAEENAN